MTDATRERLSLLRAQLSELNNRVRLYGTRLWQVPMAYFGLVVLGYTRNANSAAVPMWLTDAWLAIIGVAVILHCRAVATIQQRAIRNLANIESILDMPEPRAQFSGRTSRPFLVLMPVIVAALGISSAIRASRSDNSTAPSQAVISVPGPVERTKDDRENAGPSSRQTGSEISPEKPRPVKRNTEDKRRPNP